MHYAETPGRVFSRKIDYVNSIVRTCARKLYVVLMLYFYNFLWVIFLFGVATCEIELWVNCMNHPAGICNNCILKLSSVKIKPQSFQCKNWILKLPMVNLNPQSVKNVKNQLLRLGVTWGCFLRCRFAFGTLESVCYGI